jgi:hypothetical protein
MARHFHVGSALTPSHPGRMVSIGAGVSARSPSPHAIHMIMVLSRAAPPRRLSPSGTGFGHIPLFFSKTRKLEKHVPPVPTCPLTQNSWAKSGTGVFDICPERP